jgi:protein-arginine kinase activator protein McsA
MLPLLPHRSTLSSPFLLHKTRPSHLCHGTIDPEALTDRTTPISELQEQLQDAIDSEDYAVAAQLRDEIE